MSPRANQQTQPNFRRLDSIGDLVIEGRDDRTRINVPLRPMGDAARGRDGSINLFDEGFVWEDSRYGISFRAQSTVPIRRVTISVNDHTELRMLSSYEDILLGDQRIYRYTFELDTMQGGESTRRPFALTCGFARVEVRIEFMDAANLEFATPDIVSLDEPRKGGPEGERAEESNIRHMYDSLTRPNDNQAAEWMFSNGFTTTAGGAMSHDEHTDWAYMPISTRLQVASDSLDLVYDGLEDKGNAFPNEAGSAEHGANPHDTPENRAVRALISSMEGQVRTTCDRLRAMTAETLSVIERLKAIVSQAEAMRGRVQSLPALTMLASHLNREDELYHSARDLHERIVEMLAYVDDPHEGMGKVGMAEFHIPPREGVFVQDPTYARLYDAMLTWSACASEPIERVDLSLHALKPDKLFEYSALHHMLSWLFANGFRENESTETPIDRFAYSLADVYRKYENERRCSNTYHLARRENASHGTEVDLYFQPAIYADGHDENGVRLYRVLNEADGSFDPSSFWTPDFVVRVREDDTTRTYVLDAKYCRNGLLRDKLRECVKKYAYRTSDQPAGTPGRGIDGVALLAGKLDAPRLTVEGGPGHDGPLAIIAPFNQNTGRRKMGRFFATLGIAAARSSSSTPSSASLSS